MQWGSRASGDLQSTSPLCLLGDSKPILSLFAPSSSYPAVQLLFSEVKDERPTEEGKSHCLSAGVYLCSNPPPCPRLPGAMASHLGGSGSSRPDAWARSTPFPGPSRFGSSSCMGAPSGEKEVGRRMSQRSAWGRRGLEGRRSHPLPYPPQPLGPSLTSWGWDVTRSAQRPSRSGPQARPQGKTAQGRRMAATRPVDQACRGLGGRWQA